MKTIKGVEGMDDELTQMLVDRLMEVGNQKASIESLIFTLAQKVPQEIWLNIQAYSLQLMANWLGANICFVMRDIESYYHHKASWEKIKLETDRGYIEMEQKINEAIKESKNKLN